MVTKSDLQNLYSPLMQKAEEDARIHERDLDQSSWNPGLQRPTIQAISDNFMATEEDSEKISERNVLDFHKTLSITFKWFNLRDCHISIFLKEKYNEYYDINYFTATGTDSRGVDSTFTELERVFSAMQPQSSLLRKFKWSTITILALPTGYSLSQIINLFLFQLFPMSGPPPGGMLYLKAHLLIIYIILFFSWIGVGYSPATLLVNWLQKLWPVIEFDFGPEHLRRRKKIREPLAVVVTVLVLPLGIEVFKRYVLGW